MEGYLSWYKKRKWEEKRQIDQRLWATAFATLLTQQKQQWLKLEINCETLSIRARIFHGILSGLPKIASMQILASPQDIATALAMHGSSTRVHLDQHLRMWPWGFLATTAMDAELKETDASTLSLMVSRGGSIHLRQAVLRGSPRDLEDVCAPWFCVQGSL